jgi:hypothetical protein
VSHSIFALLVAAAGMTVASCSDSSNTFVVPVDAKAFDVPAGQPLYLKDSTISTTFPWLKDAGHRTSTCAMSMIIPPTLSIDFRPTQTGPHTGHTNALECSFDSSEALTKRSGNLTCDVPRKKTPIYFDQSIDGFFFINSGTDLDDAFAIYRALRAGQISFDAGAAMPGTDAHPVIGATKEKGRFGLSWGRCSCGQSATVERLAKSNAPTYRAHAGVNFCI